MGLKLSDTALSESLTQIRNHYNGGSMYLCAYKNNLTPGNGQVAADFTEAAFAGYARIPFTDLGSISVASSIARCEGAARTFTVSADSAGEVVYGYYVLDGSGLLLWAERAPGAPLAMDTAGQTYTVTPALDLRNH